MTYRDIPVLRSKGFACGPSGYVWSRADKDGVQWVVIEEDNSNLLSFMPLAGSSTRMSREKFDELFK